MKPEFRNESLTDFGQEAENRAMEAALAHVASQLGHSHPLLIGGEEVSTSETFRSINPSSPSQVIGEFASADARLVDRAVREAEAAFAEWQHVAPEVRARYLFHAAALMRKRKHEFSAWMVYEVGKSWVEADADTAEAIDFLEFYGREMLRLGAPQPLTPLATEENEQRYIPLGVGAIIPPWNFPLAILVGMTSAAIVSGNTVVLKPASTSATIAAQFVNLMQEVGLPAGVLNFLPGPGSKMGDALTTHPRIRFIAFTGSKEVGLRIHELAVRPQAEKIWIKRTILEMGGKNAVVVDASSDLDAAADGIVVSAFGFQGQKCSAGSRAILVREIYDPVIERVLERTQRITVGPPMDASNWMGPVIDDNAFKKIVDYMEIGTQEAKLLTGGTILEGEGYFIEPTVFGDAAPDARISQEEIFGPVLTCIKADNFDHALQIANGTEFGLTGSVFSNHRAHLEQARRDFHVGNLYLNRKCSGALVGVHPFGGFNMSGTDSKAGGGDYLLLFTQAKAISEAILPPRHF